MRAVLLALFAMPACTAAPATAADLTFPDRGRAAVVDAAHVLPPADVAALNAKVAAWDNATGHQMAIVTVPTLQGDDIADYGYKLGRAWGLGRKGINDGIVFLIAPVEHLVRIDVGRGLEGDLTDAETSVILHETVVPKLKVGDIVGAANAGADAIMAAVPAGSGDMANAAVASDWSWLIALVGLLAGSFALLIAVAVRRWRRAAAEAERRIKEARRAVERPIRTGPRFTQTGGPSQPLRATSDRYPVKAAVLAPMTVIPPSYDTSPSCGSSSSDSGSSSSSDFGSSSGFDSGGDFGGGGSDSSW